VWAANNLQDGASGQTLQLTNDDVVGSTEVAISQDSRYIAIGVRQAGKGGFGNHAIYLFNVSYG
jgi:hypothetical protein